MPNPYFAFKQFTIYQDRCAMKVTTDACLFGAWCAKQMQGHLEKLAVDIGAGTCLLSLMIAQKNNLPIDAIEINQSAAEQAKENVQLSPWPKQINIIQADATTHPFNQQYDFIISNPPFYENEIESGNKDKNTAHHSCGLKMDELFNLIYRLLDKKGSFFLLIPFKRFHAIELQLKKSKLFIHQQITIAHSPAHPPLRMMIKGGKEETEIKANELFIRTDNNYSDRFIELLKDYYLYL